MTRNWIYFQDSDGDHLVELNLDAEFWAEDGAEGDLIPALDRPLAAGRKHGGGHTMPRRSTSSVTPHGRLRSV